MAQWVVRLHLTIDADTQAQAHDVAFELGESLADYGERSLLACLIDDEEEIKLADLNTREVIHGEEG